MESTQAGGHGTTEIWMLLLVRMITRVAEPPPPEEDEMDGTPHDFYVRQDQLRKTLCDYIMSDFPARYAGVSLDLSMTSITIFTTLYTGYVWRLLG